MASAILFIGVIIGVIVIVAVIVFMDTTRASPVQPALPVSQDKNGLSQNNNNAAKSSDVNSTPGQFYNGTNMIPKQAYDPLPYP